MKPNALCLALLLAACDLPAEVEPAPDPVTVTISGTVRNNQGRAPIPGARVALLRGGENIADIVDVVADTRGLYTISTVVSQAECRQLRVAGTVRSWSSSGVSTAYADPVRCNGAPQEIDVLLRIEPF